MTDSESDTPNLRPTHPQALTSHFTSIEPNEPILLYEGPIEILKEDQSIKLDGIVYLQWLNTPTLRFEIPNSSPSYGWAADDVRLRLNDETICEHAFITIRDFNISNRRTDVKLSGIINERVVRKPDTQAVHSLFLLPNFPPIIGRCIIRHSGQLSAGRLLLESDAWKITLDSVPDSREVEKTVELELGFGVTYIGKIEKASHSKFSSEEAHNLLCALGYYLSFCSGQWTGPYLDAGFDKFGCKTWQTWHGFRTSPYKKETTWIDDGHPEQVEEGFGGFLNSWMDLRWTEALRLAIHWYVEANSMAGSIEGSIALTQTAFELLASVVIVENYGWLSSEGADKLPASDRIRLLLKWANIPTEIPTELRQLTKLAKKLNFHDTATAMTVIRNAIIHPTKKNRTKLDEFSIDARYETWKLGLWNLELCLLRICGYNGTYSNRITKKWAGEVEHVPWAQKPMSKQSDKNESE